MVTTASAEAVLLSWDWENGQVLLGNPKTFFSQEETQDVNSASHFQQDSDPEHAANAAQERLQP